VKPPEHLDLLAMLGLAAGCISAGVSLHELGIMNCATYADRSFLEDGRLSQLEPGEADLHDNYELVARSLHGLRELYLTGSPRCSLEIIERVALHAPDLRVLGISVHCPAVGQLVSWTSACCDLDKLKVVCCMEVGSERAQPHVVEVELTSIASLTACSIHYPGLKRVIGDSMTVRLVGCCHGAVISPVIQRPSCQQVVIEQRGLGGALKNATVTFEWAADEAWHARMKWDG
jgi:hypothetical protein